MLLMRMPISSFDHIPCFHLWPKQEEELKLKLTSEKPPEKHKSIFSIFLNISFNLMFNSSRALALQLPGLHGDRGCTFVRQGIFVFFGGEPGLTDKGHLCVLTGGGRVLVLLKDLHTPTHTHT